MFTIAKEIVFCLVEDLKVVGGRIHLIPFVRHEVSTQHPMKSTKAQ